MSRDQVTTDVLVMGAGLAGGIAALKAAELGARVTLVSREASATAWAQGGIVYRGEDDPDLLEKDILASGCGMNNREVVHLVATEGPGAVERWLMQRLGVPFDAGMDGNPDLTLEAAHHVRRILHVKDYTGAAIAKCLATAIAAEPKITRVDGVLLDLMVSNRNDARPGAEFSESRVVGAYIFLPATGEVRPIVASSVVLSTGGFSGLYQHSTGPFTSRGDGISAAHRAGARTLHLEFVQFHPTALFLPNQPRSLLTEALRGNGAKLVNLQGKSFVDELAPRDVVARAIHEELVTSSAPHVWLDLRGLSDFANKYPAIDQLLQSKGFDPQSERIPVVPAAHYTLGGVWTDTHGATNLPGLYAAGEVACTGLHGANRLASTSLLEALVFGERAGAAAVREAEPPRGFEARPWRFEKNPVDPALLKQDWDFLKETLWNYVGLVRSERRLKRAERTLVELRNEVEWFYKQSQLTEDLIALRHGVLVATLLLYSTMRRRDSIGTHYLKESY
ncbi:MAG: FAD-binding protein [Bdellovibrionales bacterium]|nr:FAD-binding protein [Bdellovibrionales bacterium]